MSFSIPYRQVVSMTLPRGIQITTASAPIHTACRPENTGLELAAIYTDRETTGAVLERAADLAAGLNATITLIAVCTVPYQSPFGCPQSVQVHFVEQLTRLASECKLPVRAHLVLASSWNEGFHGFLARQSTVLIGARRRLWRTREEKLARELADNGHRVALLRFDSREVR